jgi:hypothetical protein
MQIGVACIAIFLKDTNSKDILSLLFTWQLAKEIPIWNCHSKGGHMDSKVLYLNYF